MITDPTKKQLNSSFRDPSGFLFYKDEFLYRQINKSYEDNYDLLINSGLYDKLTSQNLLINHIESDYKLKVTDDAYKIIQPEKIPFITYPYEWCFSQLKDAALTLLKIQRIALEHTMSLKDASAYNMQYYKGNHIIIDTLSFEKYEEGKPWVSYRQFCQHFLAPLVLASYVDPELIKLSRLYMDGIPLELARKMLPKKTYINPGILMHLHIHGMSQKKYKDNHTSLPQNKISLNGLKGIIDSLQSTISGLNLNKRYATTWNNYYQQTNYESNSFVEKQKIVEEWTKQIQPENVWDLGSNTGIFSMTAAKYCDYVVAMDNDTLSIENSYLSCKREKMQNCYPIIIDLVNPSPSIGWALSERDSIIERGKADLVLALALIHHLVISNNTPMELVARFLSNIGNNIIIEFIPKTDSQVQKLLSTRNDIFNDYNQDTFEKTFSLFFQIIGKKEIEGSHRILYLMKIKKVS